jgi:hypothetical protein
MNKQYVVGLSEGERGVCREILKPLTGSSQKFRRAQILLKADADGPGWPDVRLAEACNCRAPTLEKLRNRLVTEGLAWAREGKQRQAPPPPCTLEGEAEAQVRALRLGTPPAGYGPWPLDLLADELVALALGEALSLETGRQVLKKTG